MLFLDEEDYELNDLETEKDEQIEDKEDDKEQVEESKDDENDEESFEGKVLRKRRHSSACRGRNSRRNSAASQGADNLQGWFIRNIYTLYRGYQMSVGLILYLLNKLNKSILCKPLVSIILFYSISSINLVTSLHEFNIYFYHIPP